MFPCPSDARGSLIDAIETRFRVFSLSELVMNSGTDQR